MDKLKSHYDELIKNYREIFVRILSAFQAQLEGKTRDEMMEFLTVDVEDNIEHQRILIQERRSSCNCAMCGACCRLAISEFSPVELANKALNGDKFAAQFSETFTPYEDENEVKDLYPEYFELIKESGEQVYFYHCLKVTDDNKCSDYENRPDICRDYPDNPLQLLHPTCSFEKWHSSIQTLVLTIKAMKEIKGHFLAEIEKLEDK